MKLSVDWKLAVKLGIGTALAYFLTFKFHQMLNQPLAQIGGLWAVISAILIVQAHLGGTYQASVNRAIGTLVGTLIGGLFTFVFNDNPLWLGFGVFCTVLISTLFPLKDALRVGCLTTALVMILWSLTPDQNPWFYSLFRLVDSIIGILSGLTCSLIFWPIRGKKLIVQKLKQAARDLANIYKHNEQEKYFTFNHQLFLIKNLYKESRWEYSTPYKNLIDQALKKLDSLYLQLYDLQNLEVYNLQLFDETFHLLISSATSTKVDQLIQNYQSDSTLKRQVQFSKDCVAFTQILKKLNTN